MKTLESPYHKK